MFNPTSLLTTIGYLGYFLIIFAESGLFIGFFLPGDSLVFTAGFLASQGILNIWMILFLGFLGAVLGDSFGYAFGKKVGPKIFTKEDSFFFHRKHLESARLYYEKHGPKTIFLARFLPIVRTFAPILAGVGAMRYSTFIIYNFAGAFAWAVVLPLIGYFLGSAIPGIDRYLIPIVILIIIISLLPSAIELFKKK